MTQELELRRYSDLFYFLTYMFLFINLYIEKYIYFFSSMDIISLCPHMIEGEYIYYCLSIMIVRCTRIKFEYFFA